MGEGRDLAPGYTGNYLVLLVGGGELGSSAAGGSGGGGKLAPDPGGASACGESCFSGELPADSATRHQYHDGITSYQKSMKEIPFRLNLASPHKNIIKRVQVR